MLTGLEVHEEDDVGSLPHGPKQLEYARRAKATPRADLLPAKTTQRHLRGAAHNTSLRLRKADAHGKCSRSEREQNSSVPRDCNKPLNINSVQAVLCCKACL